MWWATCPNTCSFVPKAFWYIYNMCLDAFCSTFLQNNVPVFPDVFIYCVLWHIYTEINFNFIKYRFCFDSNLLFFRSVWKLITRRITHLAFRSKLLSLVSIQGYTEQIQIKSFKIVEISITRLIFISIFYQRKIFNNFLFCEFHILWHFK